ncbi:MAG: S41 family peptidase [bacterium]|nr:S41 family peptidase [bacterium]
MPPSVPGKNLTRVLSALTALLLIGASFFAGAWWGTANRPAVERITNILHKEQPANFADVDFNLFWDVWTRLESKHVDKGTIDRKKILYGAIAGMVGSLGDPYTEFFPPAETKQFQQDIKGSFEGIGAEIGIRKGFLTIIAPLKGSPAEAAGLKSGDKILKIADRITADLNLDEAVRLIRGPKGTTVAFVIAREGEQKPLTITVTRDTIKVIILETEKKQDGIFVIKLYHFSENAPDEFRKAVQEFRSSGAKKLVLDMRNNPGGYLTGAVDIASWFLSSGEIVVKEQFSDGTSDAYRSSGYQGIQDIPVVVLINQGSASASEIVAGALRDVRGFKLVGQKSFGKGSVQEVENLAENSSIKITIAKWLTPKGGEINGKGLEPDVAVEMKPDQKDNEDPTMDKALEILRGMK